MEVRGEGLSGERLWGREGFALLSRKAVELSFLFTPSLVNYHGYTRLTS